MRSPNMYKRILHSNKTTRRFRGRYGTDLYRPERDVVSPPRRFYDMYNVNESGSSGRNERLNATCQEMNSIWPRDYQTMFFDYMY